MWDDSSSLQQCGWPPIGRERKEGRKSERAVVWPARELETLLAIIRFAHHALRGQPPAQKSDRAELPLPCSLAADEAALFVARLYFVIPPASPGGPA
jgi:hypothetical protein